MFLAASVALHLVLFAVLPGFVGDYAPLSARVLDVVLLKPETPPIAASEPEPLPALESRAPPRKDGVAAKTRTPDRPPAESAEPRKPETQAPQLALSEPQRIEESQPRDTAADSAESRSVPQAASEATPPQRDAAAITPPGFNAAYLRNPPPRYPLVARRNGEQGTVTLRVLVTREGVPASVSVERTSGSGHLDSAALETVKTWRFVPARQGKQPIEAWVLVPIVFRLEGTS